MKKNILLATLSLLFLSLGCSTKEKTAITMNWIIDSNISSTGEYHNTIQLINNSKTTLDKDWTIYFCLFPKRFTLDENSPVKIEKISGTFFKISPTEHYTSIGASDTLEIKYSTKNAHPGISFAPDAGYIVLSQNGVEETPTDININVIRNDAEYKALAANGNSIYYPFGDKVYDENELYSSNTPLKDTDIIPSLKQVEERTDGSKFTFTNNVKIISDTEYNKEAEMLQTSLSKISGCQFSEDAKTVIKLSKAEESTKFINNEHYLLNITENEITIKANDAHGIFNGTQTLIALIADKDLPTELNTTQISDYPDLAHRGIMLDVSRNFTKKNDVLHLIDLLALYKINVLHMHITDDEGWRIEIPGLEELTEIGSKRGHSPDESTALNPAYCGYWNANDTTTTANGYYTRQDFIEILKYAKDRHISVIPEVDMPGHARAAIIAMKARYNKYKDTDKAKAEEFLLTLPTDTSKYVSVQGYTDNVLDVALPSTYKFVEKVIDELAAMYKDAGLTIPMMHIGGDEVPKGAWTGSPACQALMKELNITAARELKDYFVEQTFKIAKPKGIRLAGWQEIVLKPHESVVDERFAKENALSFCWNTIPNGASEQVPYKLANAGFDVILCNAPNFYMDFCYSGNFYEPGHNWAGYVDDRSSFDMQPYNIYKSVRRDMKGQRIEPVSDKGKAKLQTNGRTQIRGVQGQLFTETVRNYEMVQYYLFPKMIGLAERGWNTETPWIKSQKEHDYINAVKEFNSKISLREFPKLEKAGGNFRISEPGIKIIDGQLYTNCRTLGATIRYTTDGSEPTTNSTEWTTAIPCDATIIKARAFYLGKESVTSILILNK